MLRKNKLANYVCRRYKSQLNIYGNRSYFRILGLLVKSHPSIALTLWTALNMLIEINKIFLVLKILLVLVTWKCIKWRGWLQGQLGLSPLLVQSNNKYIQGTREEWMVKSKHSYHSGSVALRQLNIIHKKAVFFNSIILL